MGIYSDNKIYGIKWTKTDFELNKEITVDVYEFKSNKELTKLEIEEIKNNFDKIDLLEMSNYTFLVYKSFTSTLDFQPFTYNTWNLITVNDLNNLFKSN